MKGRTKYLTVSAMLAALGVILLGLGSLINTLDLTVAALASILCVWAVIEMGKTYAWMIWLVTSFLAILLLPQKTPGCFYLFIGQGTVGAPAARCGMGFENSAFPRHDCALLADTSHLRPRRSRP